MSGHSDARIAQFGVRAFAHCRQCVDSMPNGESPRTWARLEVGLTDSGAVIWCTRHNALVVDLRSTHEDEKAGTLPALVPRTTIPS